VTYPISRLYCLLADPKIQSVVAVLDTGFREHIDIEPAIFNDFRKKYPFGFCACTDIRASAKKFLLFFVEGMKFSDIFFCFLGTETPIIVFVIYRR
jgi:hypothetical protein